MTRRSLHIVILGLSITSSWGNGHATTYRGLMRELARRGHRVDFLERDVPWYAANRDLPRPPFGHTELYKDLKELEERFTPVARSADLVMLGSYVPDGISVGEWVTAQAGGITAFYDIDTPVTLAKLAEGNARYLSVDLIPRFDLYLSFTGGPTLELLQAKYGAKRARPLYCSVDPEIYYPEQRVFEWILGYLGTYSPDRQPSLDRLMLSAARKWKEGRFVVAGPQYPAEIEWPANVQRIEHIAPARHRAFYNSQSFTLNITRSDMIRAGYSPSVRLFEAAACGVPIISDSWPGLEDFFEPGREILISDSPEETLGYLLALSAEELRRTGERARSRALACHCASHRAEELESYVYEML